jgi:hypothetical protein
MPKALILLTAVAALTACGSTTEDRPGDPGVYERIAASEDCAALQKEFDTASANHDRAEAGSDQGGGAPAYMKAADERMGEVGCYDESAPASEADASAKLACRHFRNVMGDLEILSTPELRTKVQEIHDNARVSEEPGVAPAAREMLAAATADDGERFLQAVGEMHGACADAGL